MKDVVKALLPPDIPPLTLWRLTVALSCFTSITFMLWAISPVGLARSSDYDQRINAVRDDINEIKLNQLEQSLYGAKESECASPYGSDARRFFAERVLGLQRQYYNLSRGLRLDIPPCQGSNRD